MSNQGRPDFSKIVAERAAQLHQHILALPADQQATFKSDPSALSTAIDTYARENGVPMLFGPAKFAQATIALSEQNPPPKVLIEFGAYVGYSALRWAALLEQLSGTPNIHVYTFELDPANAQIARDFAAAAGRSHQITVFDGPGDVSLKKLVAEGTIAQGGVDVVFIDHWEQRYVPDLQLTEELGVLHVGSLVVADNTDFPGAPDYRAYVQAGGSGKPGAVKFETKSYEADYSTEPPRRSAWGPGGGPGGPGGQGQGGPGGPGGPGGRRRPQIVEVTKVVSLGA
ncbi:hypothetical protein SEUCBS139899_006613 [Sporothrix eucalyptigena]|uniref:catechol O-methyltransferase n=1 Tax=Sporothrix eucalyptigena TaxID=1812306 RepID=A0ABP0B2A9_9PEZI